MMKSKIMGMVFGLLAATQLGAASIAFDGGWSQNNLPLKGKVNYRLGGATLGISANDAVSILFRPIGAELGQASKASWNWSFSTSVPPTDLTKKGGDDRNAALYFVFAPAAEAASLRQQSPRKVLGSTSVKTVVYVHGGSHGRNTAFQSPYLQGRGLTIVKRSAGTGASSETVDVRGDFTRAFGGGDFELIGIAVTSDSDDTNTTVNGSISGLSVN